MSEFLSGMYLAIRRTAEVMNNRKSANHPCVRGNGECCRQRNISLTFEDAKLIERAVGRRQIPESVRQQAIANASDPTREYCPFFDIEGRVCTIYRYRPIICIAYGIGGIPESNGITTDVPKGRMRALNMCHGCFNSLDGSMETVPLQDVQDYRVIAGYLEQSPRISSSDFVREILPGRRQF